MYVMQATISGHSSTGRRMSTPVKIGAQTGTPRDALVPYL